MLSLKDRESALAAVAADGFLLSYVSEELADDREVVLTAVANNGLAYTRIMSNVLRVDREIVLTAVVNNGEVYRYIGEYRNDREILLILVFFVLQKTRVQ